LILTSPKVSTPFPNLLVLWLVSGGGGGNRTPRGNQIAANGFEVRKAHQSLSTSTRNYSTLAPTAAYSSVRGLFL
jgi:hypothetical protein